MIIASSSVIIISIVIRSISVLDSMTITSFVWALKLTYGLTGLAAQQG